MLSRILSLHSRIPLRLIITPLTTSSPLKPLKPQTPKPLFFPFYPRHFSTNNNGNGGSDNDPNPASNAWNISQQPDDLEDIFGIRDDTPPVNPPPDPVGSNKAPASGTDDLWTFGGADDTSVASQVGGGGDGDVFEEFVERESGERGEAEVEPWKLGEEEKEGTVDDVFELDDETDETFSAYDDEEEAKRRAEREMIATAEKLKLEKEEKALLEVIKGPDRAFGDLVAASGITDAMLDSLIALKNFQDIEGLPPLTQIEDERYGKTLMKSSRHEMELQKQEDAAKSRVRKVDEKGRAYGTGKRKCSIARVWIQPGEGKFFINDKEFDVYFPMLDHRASLLRPFSEMKTLGLWDVKCTVQGGGVSGQVGAIRLGVSRALQNWEPGLRPPLKEAGFLTRDSRVVERKKPGKAKARKSFQWVKR